MEWQGARQGAARGDAQKYEESARWSDASLPTGQHGAKRDALDESAAHAPRSDEVQNGTALRSGSAASDRASARWTWARMTLIQDYHLSSAFIGVPKLAMILGLAPSTIWSHMRQRKFPIPYRLVNKTPMVSIDDLVDWYCARDDLVFPDEADRPSPRRVSPSEASELERQRRTDETDAIVARALAAQGITRRRRGRP